MTPETVDREFFTLAQQFNRRVDKGRPGQQQHCGAMTGAILSLAVEAATAIVIVAAIILL